MGRTPDMTDEFTREVEEAVEKTKNRVDLRVEYKSWNFTKAELLEEGLETGKSQGEAISLIKQACKKHARKCSIEATADMLETKPETIRRIYEVAERYAPDYDAEAIYEELQLSDFAKDET